MFKSIFSRMFWTNVVILTLAFFVLSAVTTVAINEYMISRQYDTVMELRETLEYWTGYLQVNHTNSKLARVNYQRTIENWADFLNAEIVIAALDGEIIEDTGGNVTAIPQTLQSKVVGGTVVKEIGNFDGQYKQKMLVIGIPMRYNGNIIAAVYVNTWMPEINKMVASLMGMFLFAAVLTLLIAFGLVYTQSNRISVPLKRINQAARDIAAGNFDKRVAVESADEIGQLCSSFNLMADSLEKVEEMRSRFISDVSHELRTPMTSISGFVRGILDGTIPPENQEKYLKIVLSESERLAKLVSDMLEMSKMSNSEYKLNVSEFDMNELIRICIISMEQRITEKSLDLDVDFGEDKLNVIADRAAIQRVVLNLLDNAVKFSYPNTTIGIKTWISGKKAHISIGNFGAGIEGSELSHVFDRFYKTDRSRTGNTTGAGLGLSFVKNIMVLHKQAIWVQSNLAKEGSQVKYTTFTFTLELA